MRSINIRKTLIVILSTLCLLFGSVAMGVAGVFTVKASDISYEEGQFYMLDGAEVSMGDDCALRFTSVISQEYYNRLSQLGTVKLHTSIGPIGYDPVIDEHTDILAFRGGEAYFYGIINYGTLSAEEMRKQGAVELTAKAYLVVEYEDGTESSKIYAERNDTTRSMRAVANMALISGDYGTDTDAKAMLEKYLGKIVREEGVQKLTPENTVVEFSSSVNGRVFLNGKRTNTFVNHETTLDIGSFITSGVVDASENILVSIMGDNGESPFDVVSKEVKYSNELKIVYTDEGGNVKTDYNILCSPTLHVNSYVPARILIEFFERATGVKGIINYKYNATAYNAATLGGKHIVIGVDNPLFEEANLPYDAEKFSTGGYAIATVGNTIFLYGGDETKEDSRGDANNYAAFKFLNELFGVEIVGKVPAPLRTLTATGDAENDKWVIEDTEGYTYDYHDVSIFLCDENVTEAGIEIRDYKEYLPDIAGRQANYGVYDNYLKEALKMNGNSSELSMKAYTVVYEEYLKIAPTLEVRAWACESDHYQYSATQPTSCNKSTCNTPDTIYDATMTVAGYKKHTAYKCSSCGRHTVSFTTPTECLGNYNTIVNGQEDNGCTKRSFSSHTAQSWHNASFYFPVQNHIHDHPDWYGDQAVFACNSCTEKYYYTDYYDTTTGDVLAETARTCASCSDGVITKYYDSASHYYKCNLCTTESTASKLGTSCSKCYIGKITAYENSTTPNYDSKVSSTGSYLRQPCFNAHGVESEYKAMVRESFEKCLNNLKYADYQELSNALANTVVDGTDHCQCDYCIKDYIKYGSMAGTVIKFVNDVNKLIDAWMLGDESTFTSFFGYTSGSDEMNKLWQKVVYDVSTETTSTVTIDLSETYTDTNGNVHKSYVKEITQYFFAYVNGSTTKTNGDQWAPVEWDDDAQKWVAKYDEVKMYKGTYASTGVYLVTESDTIDNIPKTDENGIVILDKDGNVQYYTYEEIWNGDYQYYGPENENVYTYLAEESSVRKNVKQWSDLSDGTEMYLWINTQSSLFATMPYYSANLADQGFFELLEQCGTNNLYCYASAAEDNALTAFNNLKLYVTAKRSWDTSEDLATLYDNWFKASFVDEEIIEIMEDAFYQEMSMAVRANYLQTNSSEHPDYDQDLENNPFLIGNAQAYSGYAGHNGEYWDVNQLITLFGKFEQANDLADEKFGGYEADDYKTKATHIRVKSMIYCEWYFPAAYLARFYYNSPEVLAIEGFREKIATVLKEIIDVTGIKYNAENNPPTSPYALMIYYGTQVEVVILDYTDDGAYKSSITSSLGSEPTGAELANLDGTNYMLNANSNGQLVDTINGHEVVVYDPATGELTLFEGEKYRVLLRVTNDLTDADGDVIYPAGTYITTDTAKSSGYYGATDTDETCMLYGKVVQQWPSCYAIERAEQIIYQGEKSDSYRDYSSSEALETYGVVETIAGESRKIAREVDHLNIYFGMGVTNWIGENVYNIRVTLVSGALS